MSNKKSISRTLNSKQWAEFKQMASDLEESHQDFINRYEDLCKTHFLIYHSLKTDRKCSIEWELAKDRIIQKATINFLSFQFSGIAMGLHYGDYDSESVLYVIANKRHTNLPLNLKHIHNIPNKKRINKFIDCLNRLSMED